MIYKRAKIIRGITTKLKHTSNKKMPAYPRFIRDDPSLTWLEQPLTEEEKEYINDIIESVFDSKQYTYRMRGDFVKSLRELIDKIKEAYPKWGQLTPAKQNKSVVKYKALYDFVYFQTHRNLRSPRIVVTPVKHASDTESDEQIDSSSKRMGEPEDNTAPKT